MMHHLTENEKRYVSDLIENSEKETGVHILMFFKKLGKSFDLNFILGVKNRREYSLTEFA